MDQEAAQGSGQGEVVGSLGPQTEVAATALAAKGVMPGQETERKQRVTACERVGN
jgi:hypothetical protein